MVEGKQELILLTKIPSLVTLPVSPLNVPSENSALIKPHMK